jgi:threonine dehydrogenase-like Zn-dependent dehydrogenase
MASEIVVLSFTLLPLPDGLAVSDACLVEPAAVAWHAVRRDGVASGERLLVLGGGSIGLLAAAAARYQGFSVDFFARYEHQSGAAALFGAGSVGGLYDVVIDAAGALPRCAEPARPGGRVVIVALYPSMAAFPGR